MLVCTLEPICDTNTFGVTGVEQQVIANREGGVRSKTMHCLFEGIQIHINYISDLNTGVIIINLEKLASPRIELRSTLPVVWFVKKIIDECSDFI